MATLPFPAPAAMPAVARILARFDRSTLEAFLSVAIDLIDTFDGDSDTELNGDECDTADAEDELQTRTRGGGPGCLLSDADSSVDDSGIDEREEGDREEDHALECPLPIYGLDQRGVLAPNGHIAFQH